MGRGFVSELTLVDQSNDQKWRTFREPGGFSWSVTPGEWTVLGDRPDMETVDLTSVRAMYRLSGDQSPDLLNKICGLDFSDETFPDRSAARTLVAGVATEIVRDDRAGRSYLLLPSRSFGRYMEETIRDAGIEFGLSVTPASDPSGS